MAFATDNFDSLTAAAELNGRTASDGVTTWSATAGNFEGETTSGAKVQSKSNGGRVIAFNSATPAGTDYSVTGTLSVSGTGASGLMLAVRCVSTNTTAIIAGWTAFGDWRVASHDGAGDHPIASGTATNAATTPRVCTLTIAGVNPTITYTFVVAGTTIYSGTYNPGNTNFDAKGQAGIYNNFSDVNTLIYVDDWSASDTSSATRPVKMAGEWGGYAGVGGGFAG